MDTTHLIRNAALLLVGLLLPATLFAASPERVCTPTEKDALGPFYLPGAPVRSKVGTGYVLEGTVRSAPNCTPVPGARIELWLAGPDGRYGDSYRATVISDDAGRYRFESHYPPPYSGRPSHIHVRVTAAGFGELVTQHYPARGERRALFDLVLVPSP